jgi:hypothetical protein
MTDDTAGRMLHNILSPASQPGPPYVHTLAATVPDPDEAVAWLRRQIEADKATALDACDRDGRQGIWLLRDHPSDSVMVREGNGGSPVVYDEGAPSDAEAAHIARHDPRDKIADCEAKLVILDLHRSAHLTFSGSASFGCVVCHVGANGEDYNDGFCETMIALASAYQYRDGYTTYWGIPPTHTITEE